MPLESSGEYVRGLSFEYERAAIFLGLMTSYLQHPKAKRPKFRLGGDSQALANQLLALIFTQATPNAVGLAIG